MSDFDTRETDLLVRRNEFFHVMSSAVRTYLGFGGFEVLRRNHGSKLVAETFHVNSPVPLHRLSVQFGRRLTRTLLHPHLFRSLSLDHALSIKERNKNQKQKDRKVRGSQQRERESARAGGWGRFQEIELCAYIYRRSRLKVKS